MSLVYKDVDNLLIQLCYSQIEKAVQPRGESFDIGGIKCVGSCGRGR